MKSPWMWNAPTQAELERWARQYLLIAARDAPDHLIQHKRVTITVELRDGTEHEVVAEGWV